MRRTSRTSSTLLRYLKASHEYFLNYHVGIVFFVVGVLAYSQMSSLSPLWFWTLGDVFVVPSALMLFLCALMCAVTVLCALAVTLVDAFCRDHRRLAAQINPDLDEEVARTHSSLRYLFPTLAFAVLTLLLLGGSLPGRVQSRTKEMLSLIDDYLREVVEEVGDAKYLFTDGHFDCGLELESARRGGELVCIAAQPSPNARSGYALSSLMDDEHDRLSAAADGANLLRTWQRDRPERLERCALQVGLELWRQRSKLEYPSVSGVVARPGRSDDRARDEGIRRTLGIAERILKFYSGGEIPREAGTGVTTSSSCSGASRVWPVTVPRCWASAGALPRRRPRPSCRSRWTSGTNHSTASYRR